MPTPAQLILLGVSVAFFALGGLVSFARLWHDRPAFRSMTQACMLGGVATTLGLILWHTALRRQCPLNDNFAALVFLALLLSTFVMYIQHVRPLVGLDWFVMPVVILLLVVGGIFGRVEYHTYGPLVSDTWLWVHRVSTYGGAVAFAFAAAAGAMYIIASRRLRRKTPLSAFGSLERLERMIVHSATLGFAMLTIGLITGFFRMFQRGQTLPPAKLLLGSLSWLIYAAVLHAPMNPRFRGRRVAILSVLGFLLLIGAIIVVQLMPGGDL